VYKIAKYTAVFSVLATLAFSLVLAPVANAQTGFFGGNASGDEFAGTAGLGSADLTTTIAQIINVVLSFLGIVAVCLILWGGFKWMTAAGNDDAIGEAKKILIGGIIGLVIIMSAYAIASFVINNLSSATGTTGEAGV
jgi:hypothetical protein